MGWGVPWINDTTDMEDLLLLKLFNGEWGGVEAHAQLGTIFVSRYPPGVREWGELLYRCQVEQGSNSGTISWLCELEQIACLL